MTHHATLAKQYFTTREVREDFLKSLINQLDDEQWAGFIESHHPALIDDMGIEFTDRIIESILGLRTAYTHIQVYIRNDEEGDGQSGCELLKEHPITGKVKRQMRALLSRWLGGPCTTWDDHTNVAPDGTITMTCPDDPSIFAVAKPTEGTLSP